MNVFDEAKVDCHFHVLDPARFAYGERVAYRPAGQEIGTQQQHHGVMEAYGIRHALIVGPNSGYGEDNRCLLDTIAAGTGRYKGIAVVALDTSREQLAELKAQDVVGVAFNATANGVEYYAASHAVMRRLADLDMFVQIQVDGDQMVEIAPWLIDGGAKILVDHCGRPDPLLGIAQPGFQAVLGLARSGRATVKLSGLQKFSRQGWPYADTRVYINALIEAFTLDHCVWASDWPFLKASERVDIGPLLRSVELLLPDARDRHRLFWETPMRLFGFGNSNQPASAGNTQS